MDNDPKGREQLLQLGARNVPVIAKGKNFVLGQNLEEVAKFLGLQGTGHVALPPQELFKKWTDNLRTAQRYVRQIPDDQMNLRGLQNRDRAIRQLCHHIFRIGEAHLECAVNGARNLEELTRVPLAEGAFITGEAIARYGDGVITRLERWWNGLADKSFRQRIEIHNYGMITTHQLLERSAWHSAHHTRQIADVLKRKGIEPDGILDLAGLPMPDQIWD